VFHLDIRDYIVKFRKRRAAALLAQAGSGVLGPVRKVAVRKRSALLGLVIVTAALAVVAGPSQRALAVGPCFQGGYTFGIAPGSGARSGGVSNLWLTANSSGSVTVQAGNGSAGQQWCVVDTTVDGLVGFNLDIYGNFGFGTKWYCLDDLGNAKAGQQVWVEPCSWQSDGDNVFNQEWMVVGEGDNSYSFAPRWLSSGTVWLDIWGGPGTSAFKAGHIAQLWTGNGGDNQAYTTYQSNTGHAVPHPLAVNY
jgi:hypothetical protein